MIKRSKGQISSAQGYESWCNKIYLSLLAILPTSIWISIWNRDDQYFQIKLHLKVIKISLHKFLLIKYLFKLFGF